MQPTSGMAAPRANWLVAAAVCVLLGLVLRVAWVTEDAYITLRTVDNLVNGFGLRWNVSERVQSYTHPLWMVMMSALYFVTREHFLTTVALSFGTTAAALWLLVRYARTAEHALCALLLLTFSRSFIDFSTSGLENPLSHLLLSAFVGAYVVSPKSLRVLTLISALLALSRNDAVLLVAPALVHAALISRRERGLKRTAIDALVGLSPFFAWELFSLFYYGVPFPNTAYAKLNTGIPKNELAEQGFVYLLNTFAWDTPGMLGLALAFGLTFHFGELRERLLCWGVLLYLAYVVRVGGDFMIGRFVTLPLYLAISAFSRLELPADPRKWLALQLAPFALLFLHRDATEEFKVGDLEHSGVADERAFFRDDASLVLATRTSSMPRHGWAEEGRAWRDSGRKVFAQGSVGFRGMFAGPGVHIVDWHALTDPLLARLPVRFNPSWRVGHYFRPIPPGYLETIEQGKCVMPDANLCAYYAKLQEVVSGDLLSWSRLKTAVALNFGAYEHLIDKDRYRFPELVREPLARLSAPLPEDARWDSAEARVFQADGIEIDLQRVARGKSLQLLLDGNDSYEVEFRLGTDVVGRAAIPSKGRGNLHTRHVDVPKDVQERGYDRVRIRPLHGDGMYAVGYLRLR